MKLQTNRRQNSRFLQHHHRSSWSECLNTCKLKAYYWQRNAKKGKATFNIRTINHQSGTKVLTCNSRIARLNLTKLTDPNMIFFYSLIVIASVRSCWVSPLSLTRASLQREENRPHQRIQISWSVIQVLELRGWSNSTTDLAATVPVRVQESAGIADPFRDRRRWQRRRRGWWEANLAGGLCWGWV